MSEGGRLHREVGQVERYVDLHGTIRGQRVRFEDYGQREVGSIAGLGDKYTVTSHVFPGLTGDRNTLRVGVVVITGRR